MRKCIHKHLAAVILGLTVLSLGCNDILGSGQRATAILKVSREKKGNASDFMIYKETQAEMLISHFVITAALRDPNLSKIQGASVSTIAAALSVQCGEDEIIGVSLTSGAWTKHETELLLDGVIDAYLQEVVEKERLEKTPQLSKLRIRDRQLTDQRKRGAEELSELQQATDQKHLSSVESKIQQLQSNLIELQLQEVEEQENDADDKRLATTQAKIDFIEKELVTHNEELSKLKADMERLAVERDRTESLKKDQATVLEEIQLLESEIDGSSSVSVLQRAIVVQN